MKFVVILFALFSLPTGKALANPVYYGPTLEDDIAKMKKAGLKVCPKCKGFGRESHYLNSLICARCKGMGGIRVCWRCDGSGRIWRWWLWRTVCPTCKGSGDWKSWSGGRPFK